MRRSGTGSTDAIGWRVSGQWPLPVESHCRAASRLKKCCDTRLPRPSRKTPTGALCSDSKQIGHSACASATPRSDDTCDETIGMPIGTDDPPPSTALPIGTAPPIGTPPPIGTACATATGAAFGTST